MTVERLESEDMTHHFRVILGEHNKETEERLRREYLKDHQRNLEWAFSKVLGRVGKSNLPLVVVDKKYDTYRLMFGIPEPGDLIKYCFDQEGNIYERVSPKDPVWVEEKSPIGISDIEQVLLLLEKAVAIKENAGRVVVPSGFFVFRFKNQSAGEEQDTTLFVIKEDTLKGAVLLLGGTFLFSRMKGTRFWDFEVNTGEGWKQVEENWTEPADPQTIERKMPKNSELRVYMDSGNLKEREIVNRFRKIKEKTGLGFDIVPADELTVVWGNRTYQGWASVNWLLHQMEE